MKKVLTGLFAIVLITAGLGGEVLGQGGGRVRKPAKPDSGVVFLPAVIRPVVRSKMVKTDPAVVDYKASIIALPAAPEYASTSSQFFYFETEVPVGRFANSNLVKLKLEGKVFEVILGIMSHFKGEGLLDFDASTDGLKILRAVGFTDAEIEKLVAVAKGGNSNPSGTGTGTGATAGGAGFTGLAGDEQVLFVRELSVGSGRMLKQEEVLSSRMMLRKLLSFSDLSSDEGLGKDIKRRAAKLISGIVWKRVEAGIEIYDTIVAVLPVPLPTVEELKSWAKSVWNDLTNKNQLLKVVLVEGTSSPSVVQGRRPSFEVAAQNLKEADGRNGDIDLDRYEPVIVKAGVSARLQRIFYAEAAEYLEDKNIKTHPIREQRIAVETVDRKGGQVIIRPSADLEPGEYAVTLRSRTETDVPTRVGLWTFSVK